MITYGKKKRKTPLLATIRTDDTDNRSQARGSNASEGWMPPIMKHKSPQQGAGGDDTIDNLANFLLEDSPGKSTESMKTVEPALERRVSLLLKQSKTPGMALPGLDRALRHARRTRPLSTFRLHGSSASLEVSSKKHRRLRSASPTAQRVYSAGLEELESARSEHEAAEIVRIGPSRKPNKRINTIMADCKGKSTQPESSGLSVLESPHTTTSPVKSNIERGKRAVGRVRDAFKKCTGYPTTQPSPSNASHEVDQKLIQDGTQSEQAVLPADEGIKALDRRLAEDLNLDKQKARALTGLEGDIQPPFIGPPPAQHPINLAEKRERSTPRLRLQPQTGSNGKTRLGVIDASTPSMMDLQYDPSNEHHDTVDVREQAGNSQPQLGKIATSSSNVNGQLRKATEERVADVTVVEAAAQTEPPPVTDNQQQPRPAPAAKTPNISIMATETMSVSKLALKPYMSSKVQRIFQLGPRRKSSTRLADSHKDKKQGKRANKRAAQFPPGYAPTSEELSEDELAQ